MTFTTFDRRKGDLGGYCWACGRKLRRSATEHTHCAKCRKKFSAVEARGAVPRRGLPRVVGPTPTTHERKRP